MSPTSGRCSRTEKGLPHGAKVAIRAVVFVAALASGAVRPVAAAPMLTADSLGSRGASTPARADTTAASIARSGPPPVVRGPLTLERALELALGAPPSVAEARFAATAELARAREEAHAPDPSADATVENFGPRMQSRDEGTFTYTQPLFWGGRLKARRAVVGALEKGLPVDVEVARRQFARAIGETFVEAWWLEQRLHVLARTEDVDAATIRSSEERTRAGAAPITEALRARTTLAQATIDRRHAETDLADSRLKLAQSWGAHTADFDTLLLPPPAAAAVPRLDTLLAGIDRRPEIRRAANATAVAAARLGVAKSERPPELSVVGGVRYLDEIQAVLFLAGVSARLPIWDRQKNTIAAAQADLDAAQLRERTMRLELERQLTGAWRRCRAAADDYALARDTALPAAREALVKLGEGYRAGRFRYLDYLDGQHAAFDAELAMLDAAKEYWNARLALEWSPADAGSSGP